MDGRRAVRHLEMFRNGTSRVGLLLQFEKKKHRTGDGAATGRVVISIVRAMGPPFFVGTGTRKEKKFKTLILFLSLLFFLSGNDRVGLTNREIKVTVTGVAFYWQAL